MNEIISNQIAQYRYYKNVNQGLMSYLFRLYKENNFKYSLPDFDSSTINRISLSNRNNTVSLKMYYLSCFCNGSSKIFLVITARNMGATTRIACFEV